ncbi:SMODS domain-containing nucleotidyltransferase [Streptomyces sp. DT18]
MTYPIADLFDDFVRHITLSDSEKATALEQGRRLSQRIEQRPEVRECLITGSMTRSTAIRKFSDVDIVAVIEPENELAQADSATLVTAVANILRETEPHVEVSENAVRVVYAECVTVDVLAAIYFGTNNTGDDVYRIPTSNQDGWETYAPEEQSRRIREAAEFFGDDFKKLIRLCKWWSKTHSQPVSSHDIELVAYKSFTDDIPEIPQALIEMFNAIEHSIDTGSPKMAIVLQSKSIAIEAYSSWQSGDTQKSIELWGRLFGDRFPTVIT